MDGDRKSGLDDPRTLRNRSRSSRRRFMFYTPRVFDGGMRQPRSTSRTFAQPSSLRTLKGAFMFSRKQKFPVGKVAIAFGIGAVSGAVLALLYAPLTGKKLQKKVADVTENLIDKVEENVEGAQKPTVRVAPG